MIKSSPVIGWGGCLLAAVLIGCGGPQETKKLSADELLADGRYADARAAVAARGGGAPRDQAIVAVSRIAERPDRESAKAAVELLHAGGQVEAAVAANELLALMFTLPADVDNEVSILAVEVALGAAGLGPLARVEVTPVPGSEISTSLAISVLERLHLWLAVYSGAVDPPRLLDGWNGCYTLLGGSLEQGNDLDAWRLYSSLAHLSVLVHDGAPGSSLSTVMLRTTVEAVEQNTEIAVAVRCDLSSPLDKLRSALARDRELGGRLERATGTAEGCTRGTYAPRGR